MILSLWTQFLVLRSSEGKVKWVDDTYSPMHDLGETEISRIRSQLNDMLSELVLIFSYQFKALGLLLSIYNIMLK